MPSLEINSITRTGSIYLYGHAFGSNDLLRGPSAFVPAPQKSKAHMAIKNEDDTSSLADAAKQLFRLPAKVPDHRNQRTSPWASQVDKPLELRHKWSVLRARARTQKWPSIATAAFHICRSVHENSSSATQIKG